MRAYTAAARAALKAAGIQRMTPWLQGSLTCSYSLYDRLCRLLRDRGARVEDSAFGAQVEILFTVPLPQAESLAETLRDATAGAAVPRFGAQVLRGCPQ